VANRARDLSNRPPNDLTPERLAERAAEIAQGSTTLSFEVVRPRPDRGDGHGLVRRRRAGEPQRAAR
jgi:leucyl aminopeptidase